MPVSEYGAWSFEKAKEYVASWRGLGGPVAFTNGCFELFHYGHAHFLADCRVKTPRGGCLIVAVNDDNSFLHLKHRAPLMHEKWRWYVVGSHASVSLAFLWHGIRITECLSVLQPDIWFKGGDYSLETLEGSEVEMAKEVGTKIELLPMHDCLSTTKIIDTIRKTGTGGMTVVNSGKTKKRYGKTQSK